MPFDLTEQTMLFVQFEAIFERGTATLGLIPRTRSPTIRTQNSERRAGTQHTETFTSPPYEAPVASGFDLPFHELGRVLGREAATKLL